MRTKRVVTLLLAMLLIVGLLGPAALADDNLNESGLPIVKEPITLKIAVLRHNADATESYADKYIVKQAAEATNINIEWIEITGNAAERVGIMLAGDLPDIFLGPLTDAQMVQNTSLFVPLNGLLEENCPNILEMYKTSVPDWEGYLTYPDGNIYGLMGSFLKSYTDQITGVMYINTEWLKNVGKEMPTTVEELVDVLTAFRDMDADGDGDPNNEIPLDFCQNNYAATYWMMAYNYGIPNYYDISDGKIIETVNTDTFRKFLTDFHEMAAGGLLNVEGLTQTHEQYSSNLASMKVGCFWGWAPYSFINDPEGQAQYAAVPPLPADGNTPRMFNAKNTSRRNNFVITTACKNVEAALRWWDYLSRDQEAALESRNGPVGLNFYQGDDGRYYSRKATPETAAEYGYEAFANNIGTSTWAASMGITVCSPLILESPIVDVEADPTNSTAIRQAAVALSEPFFAPESMSLAIVPADKQEELEFGTDGMFAYVDAFVADSILNGVTDASWDAYVSGLETHGYSFYISWLQDYFDGNFVN